MYGKFTSYSMACRTTGSHPLVSRSVGRVSTDTNVDDHRFVLLVSPIIRLIVESTPRKRHSRSLDHVPLPLSRAPDGLGGMTLLSHVAQLNAGSADYHEGEEENGVGPYHEGEDVPYSMAAQSRGFWDHDIAYLPSQYDSPTPLDECGAVPPVESGVSFDPMDPPLGNAQPRCYRGEQSYHSSLVPPNAQRPLDPQDGVSKNSATSQTGSRSSGLAKRLTCRQS